MEEVPPAAIESPPAVACCLASIPSSGTELFPLGAYPRVPIKLEPEFPDNRTRKLGELADPPRWILRIVHARFFFSFLSASCQRFPWRVSNYVPLGVGVTPCVHRKVVA